MLRLGANSLTVVICTSETRGREITTTVTQTSSSTVVVGRKRLIDTPKMPGIKLKGIPIDAQLNEIDWSKKIGNRSVFFVKLPFVEISGYPHTQAQ